MNIKKEQLLVISNLELSSIMNVMDENQYAGYCLSLDLFIEHFPNLEEKLKTSLQNKDFGTFAQILSVLHDELVKVCANSLAQRCLNLISMVKSSQYDMVESNLTNLLTLISALSIDIQMAQHSDEAVIASEPTAAEKEKVDVGEKQQKIILAVDDVSFLLNSLKVVLLNTDYKLTCVTSGAAALKFIEKFTPDLFILDIEMPEMNGYELAVKIKQRGLKAPIIFLTGNATKDYLLKAIQSGGSDFIVKPVNKEQVLEKIKKFIG